MAPLDLPVGPHVPDITAAALPKAPPAGKFVLLRPLEPAADAPGLFAVSHGSPQHDAIWTYLAYGPFADAAAMETWLQEQAPKTDPLFLAVCGRENGETLGMVSFLNIVPDMRRLELGHIWYGLKTQRTKTNTESIYLMLRSAFEDWHYRRVDWKCDSLNARSRAAALRLGFRYEGLFRQHMIYKGRNRDTAWFAMMDHEWPAVKRGMEEWLYDEAGVAAGASLSGLIHRKGE